jgi:hypothetical protein
MSVARITGILAGPAAALARGAPGRRNARTMSRQRNDLTTEFSLLDPRNLRTRVEYRPVMQLTRGSLGKPPPLEESQMKVDLGGSFLFDA